MAGWNMRKLQILEYADEVGEVSSFDVAEALNLEIHNARTLLLKYHRQGLLSRYTVDAYGTRLYEITGKGVERIGWIRSRMEEASEARDLEEDAEED